MENKIISAGRATGNYFSAREIIVSGSLLKQILLSLPCQLLSFDASSDFNLLGKELISNHFFFILVH